MKDIGRIIVICLVIVLAVVCFAAGKNGVAGVLALIGTVFGLGTGRKQRGRDEVRRIKKDGGNDAVRDDVLRRLRDRQAK